jgi:lipid-A-disaccharide synthase-like uncharacterized protein
MLITNVTISNVIWLTVGFGGQILFTGRFIIQWLYSEKHKRSLIPPSFWYLSVFGGIVLLTYAVHKKDPVFIAGQLFGLLVYSRNLYFVIQERKKLRTLSPKDHP